MLKIFVRRYAKAKPESQEQIRLQSSAIQKLLKSRDFSFVTHKTGDQTLYMTGEVTKQ